MGRRTTRGAYAGEVGTRVDGTSTRAGSTGAEIVGAGARADDEEAGAAEVAWRVAMNPGEASIASLSLPSSESSSNAEDASLSNATLSFALLLARRRLWSRFGCSHVDHEQQRSFHAFACSAVARLMAWDPDVHGA